MATQIVSQPCASHFITFLYLVVFSIYICFFFFYLQCVKLSHICLLCITPIHPLPSNSIHLCPHILPNSMPPPSHSLPQKLSVLIWAAFFCVRLAACTRPRTLWLYRQPTLCGDNLWHHVPPTWKRPHLHLPRQTPWQASLSKSKSITDKMSNTFVSISSLWQKLYLLVGPVSRLPEL